MGRIMNYKLNGALKTRALAKEYKKTGRVRVIDALERKSADNLSSTIEQMAIWSKVYLVGDDEQRVTSTQEQSKTNRRLREAVERIYLQARDQYQYLRYECLTSTIPNAKDPKALKDADKFFKSDEFRDFLRAIAGVKDGELENVQARWLNREQFMSDSGLAKKLADCKLWFSMDVTRKWRPQWGGNLEFLDGDGAIEEIWSPLFNSLNIYTGGTRHSISYVTPYHDAFCLSICGRLK